MTFTPGRRAPLEKTAMLNGTAVIGGTLTHNDQPSQERVFSKQRRVTTAITVPKNQHDLVSNSITQMGLSIQS